MACWNSRSRPPPDHRRDSRSRPPPDHRRGVTLQVWVGRGRPVRKRSKSRRMRARKRRGHCAAKQRTVAAVALNRRARGPISQVRETWETPHARPLDQIPLRFRARALRRWFATGRTRAVNERRTLRRAINCDCVRAGGLETVQIVGLVIPTHPSPHPSSPPSRCSRTRNSPRRPSKA